MVVILQDNKIRIIKLTGDELNLVIEEMERIPHNIYEFMRYDKIVKKLKCALSETIEVAI